MDNLRSCYICMEKYCSTPETQPTSLSCGHSLCINCATKLSEGRVIVCPMCKLMSVVPAQGLPKNYAMI